MSKDFLKEKNFSDNQIQQITPEDFVIIRNFFSTQEIVNIDKDRIIQAAKLLEPIFKNVKVVDMMDYINTSKKKSGNISNDSSPPDNQSLEPSPMPSVSSESQDALGSGEYENEVNRLLEGKYLVQQLWILEHLINNPNLLNSAQSIEISKKRLHEKEQELEVHNLIMAKFFKVISTVDDVRVVLRFKHFESIKKDIAWRILLLKKNSLVDFKSVVDVFREFGFEENEELNVSFCKVLSSMIDDPKIQKLLKYTKHNFNTIDLVAEKKRYLRKCFKD